LVKSDGLRIDFLVKLTASSTAEAKAHIGRLSVSIGIEGQPGDRSGADGCATWLGSVRRLVDSIAPGTASEVKPGKNRTFAVLDVSLKTRDPQLVMMGLQTRSRLACTSRDAFMVGLVMGMDEYRPPDSALFDAVLDSTTIVDARADSALLLPNVGHSFGVAVDRPGFVVIGEEMNGERSTLTALDEASGVRLSIAISSRIGAGKSAHFCDDSLLSTGRLFAAPAALDPRDLSSSAVANGLTLHALRLTDRAGERIQFACMTKGDSVAWLLARTSDQGPEVDAQYAAILRATSMFELAPRRSRE
jgi:hypothetical protein